MSAPKRFFVPAAAVGESCILSGEEFEHAKNVLRIGVGDEVVLLDNSGKEYSAVVATVGKREMTLTVVRSSDGDREPSAEICLLFGYLKNADRNEFIVQKGVELGVRRLIAFSSEYSSAFMNDNKLERLNKVSREAAKQCLRSVAPTVEYAPTLAAALESAKDYQNKLFACEFTDKTAGVNFQNLTGDCAIVVGSEGGFSVAEETLAKSLGFQSISLGKRILRAETAAVAFTAVVAYTLGELGLGKGEDGR